MRIKLAIASVLTCLLISCQPSSEKINFKTLSERFSSIQKTFKDKTRQVRSNDEYQALVQKRNRDLQKLLSAAGTVPYSEEREILTAKIYLQLNRFEQAEKMIDPILNKGSAAALTAKMTKVQILIFQKHDTEALKLFREIEPQLNRDDDFFSASLYFALKSKNHDVLEQYSTKLLEAKDLPEEYEVFRGRMYASLSTAAYRKGNLNQARTHMEDALQMAGQTIEKRFFQARLSQLQLIGSKAPEIPANIWINSPPLNLAGLKGKVIVIDFWAPWSAPCRKILPELLDLYSTHRKSDLIIIGYTKLYGMYRDDIEEKNGVDKTEELALIKKYIKRKQIPYPIAISNEGQGFANYFIAGIPAMILIDKSGQVSHVQMGASNISVFKEKILEQIQN